MDKKAMMEALAEKAYEKGGFNGTWLYAENGEIVSKGALGWRDAEDTLPMQEDTIFEMASITKMFTATAVMLLVREGKLGLDEALTEIFPEYPYPGVTIRHLLTHTSGIPDFDVEELVTEVREQQGQIPANGSVFHAICARREAPRRAPGEEFCYSDIGYTMLAHTVETVSGMPFEAFVQKHIFAPAGMKDSGIYHTRRDGRPSDRFARNMVLENGAFVPSERSRFADYVVGSDGLNGCDYLYTTIFDMLAWDKALREETVLTAKEQETMYALYRLNNGEIAGADEDDDGYAFGWAVANEPENGFIVRHSGGMPGLETWFERFVDKNRVLVVLDCRDYADARAFNGLFAGFEAIARDKAPEPIQTIEDLAIENPDKSKWESFCGKYEHPEEADFIIDEVYMKDGELFANAIDDEGDDLTFRLYPIGENTFGRKGGMLRVSFGENCLTFDEQTFNKLS